MNKEINFTLHLYTDIIFGKDTEKEAGRMVRKHGGSRVMLVYGGGSVKKSGLLGRVVGALKEEGLYFIEFGGVQPNPRRSLIEKGIKAAQDDKIDFLLALGGGSVIDSCKAIALALANGGEYWKFYNKAPVEKMAPIGAITTISATGSETSRSTVVLDDIETGFKRSVNNDCCRPRFAIMNPELCYSVSSYQTGAGAVDIAAHALGRYFLRDYAFSRLGDEFAEGLLRTVVKYASTAISNPCDYTARAELMMAAAFSHNDLVCLGCKGLGAGEHALERQFSGYYDVAHGAGLAVVMPAWLQYIVDNGTPGHHARIAQFGTAVFGINPEISGLKAAANASLEAFRAWIRSLGMPLTLSELGIPKKELDTLIKQTVDVNNGKISGFMDLDEKAITAIITSIA